MQVAMLTQRLRLLPRISVPQKAAARRLFVGLRPHDSFGNRKPRFIAQRLVSVNAMPMRARPSPSVERHCDSVHPAQSLRLLLSFGNIPMPFDLPPVTRNLLIANVVVFLLQLMLHDSTSFALTQHFALWPLGPDVTGTNANGDVITAGFRVWQVLTYAFMHGGG
jgi:membrane associated rhomboid family serine protease